MYIRSFMTAAAMALAVTGCGSTAPSDRGEASSPGAGQLVSSDESVRVDVPAGWNAVPDKQQGTVVLVAQGTDPIEQLIVSRESDTSGAYDNALFTVTGLTSKGADCQPGTIDGHESFDCADEFEGQPFHRVFVAVEADDGSYGFLVQTPATTANDALAVVTPLIESIDLQ